MMHQDLLASLTETRAKIQVATDQLNHSFELAKGVGPKDDSREVHDLKRNNKVAQRGTAEACNGSQHSGWATH